MMNNGQKICASCENEHCSASAKVTKDALSLLPALLPADLIDFVFN